MDALNRSLGTPHQIVTKLLRMSMIAGIVTGLVVGQGVPVAHAASSVTVDRTDDPQPIPAFCTSAGNDCSLRGAIIYANAHPNTEIIVEHGTSYTLSIAAAGPDDATTGDLNITADTTIDFGNSICFVNCPATVKGGTGWSDRIFHVMPGATAHMVGLTITNGNVSTGGGGLMNQGNLTFSAGTISGNTTTDYGGGIYNSGTLTMTNSTVTNNTAQRDGGGIANYNGTLTMSDSDVTLNNAVASASQGGGGLFITNAGVATISDSTFASNTTERDGGGILAGGAMTLTNSTVSGNTATMHGGGINGYALLKITGGSITANTATNYYGGGLYCSSDTVVVDGVDISGNHSKGEGGGIYASGPFHMTVTNSTVNNNQTTSGNGGGIYSTTGALTVQLDSTVSGNMIGGGSGAGLFVNGPLTMTNTTVSGNSGATEGGGIFLQATTAFIAESTISNNDISGTSSAAGGGLDLALGELTMTASTVSDNTASGTNARGGGIHSEAGSALTLVASTLANNTAPQGGGLDVGQSVAIINSTFSGNTATTGFGGGMYLPNSGVLASLSGVTITNNHAPNGEGGGIRNMGTVTLKNTLIAGNTAGMSGFDCSGGLTSQGYNLLGSTYGCVGLATGVNGDLVGNPGTPLNPYIGALANNGGPTMTHALLVNSPAIDAGNPTGCLATDQRGVARPVFARCDIGAYEYNGPGDPVPHINTLNPATVKAGDPAFTLTVNGANFIASSVVKWNGSNRPTTYVNAGQLTAQISAADFPLPGTKNVTVFNPTPGGGTSNTATLSVSTSPNVHYLYLPLTEK